MAPPRLLEFVIPLSSATATPEVSLKNVVRPISSFSTNRPYCVALGNPGAHHRHLQFGRSHYATPSRNVQNCRISSRQVLPKPLHHQNSRPSPQCLPILVLGLPDQISVSCSPNPCNRPCHPQIVRSLPQCSR